MFTENSKPLSEKVRDREYKEYKKLLHSEHTTLEDTADKYQSGNVLYLVDKGKKSYSDLLVGYNQLTKELSFSGVDPIFKEVTTKIINIKAGATIENCLKVIAPYRKKAGLNFYGALLRSTSKKSTIINPFHPLTALALSNPHNRGETYNILIYFYPKRSKLDIKYKSRTANIEAMNTNINDILRTYQSNIRKEQMVEKVEQQEHNKDTFNIIYRTKTDANSVDGADYYIVSHQLMTKGIIGPYYGTSFIKKAGNGTFGKHLTPFRSANISVSDNITTWTSVCTGSQPKNFEGFKSLTHSNLSSPYHTGNIMNGALIYADLCINKSYDIYHKIGLIDSTEGLIIEPQLRITPTLLMDRLSKEFVELFYTNKMLFTKNLALDKNWTKDDIHKVIQELTERKPTNETAPQRVDTTRAEPTRFQATTTATTGTWGTPAGPFI